MTETKSDPVEAAPAPLLSVIVPIYNGADFLAECLESILAQTMGDFELVCVDDGSTDATPEMLAGYAGRDGRVRVLRQQNAGASAARNAGLACARGRYVLFLDDDDWFEPEMFELMCAALERDGADLCVCGAYRFDMRTGERSVIAGAVRSELLPQTMPLITEEFAQGGHLFDFTTFHCFTKMCRRALLLEHGITFGPYRRSEDSLFVAEVMLASERITVVDWPLVNYRAGMAGKLSDEMSDDMLTGLTVLLRIKGMLVERGLYSGPYQQSFANRALSHLLYVGDHASSFGEFEEWFAALVGGGFEELDLLGREPGYFYDEGHYAQMQAMLAAPSAAEFAFARYRRVAADRDDKAAKVRKLRVQKQRLAERGERVQARNVELKEKNATVQARNVELKEQNGRLRERNAALKERSERVQARNVELKEKNATVQARNVELKEQNGRLEDELSRIKNSRSYRMAMRLRGAAKKLGL